ncbi:MAG: hypothetical protein WKF84_06490 [Pyrinomonadaceae bacterium]
MNRSEVASATIKARDIYRFVRVIDQLYEFIARVALSISIRIAFDLLRGRVIRRHIGKDLLDAYREGYTYLGLRRYFRAVIVGSGDSYCCCSLIYCCHVPLLVDNN